MNEIAYEAELRCEVIKSRSDKEEESSQFNRDKTLTCLEDEACEEHVTVVMETGVYIHDQFNIGNESKKYISNPAVNVYFKRWCEVSSQILFDCTTKHKFPIFFGLTIIF